MLKAFEDHLCNNVTRVQHRQTCVRKWRLLWHDFDDKIDATLHSNCLTLQEIDYPRAHMLRKSTSYLLNIGVTY